MFSEGRACVSTCPSLKHEAECDALCDRLLRRRWLHLLSEKDLDHQPRAEIRIRRNPVKACRRC